MCPTDMLPVLLYFGLLFGGWYVVQSNYIDPVKCIQCTIGLTLMSQSKLGRNDPLKYLMIILLLSGDIHEDPGPILDTVVKNLSVCHINAQSIYNKLDLIAVELSEFDIITVSETWLDRTIKNSELLLPSYQPPIRLDRNRQGGGWCGCLRQTMHTNY